MSLFKKAFAGINPVALFGTAAQVGGSILDYRSQRKATAASARSVEDQHRFQEYMSSTAYQRAVQDMKGAGINPMVAYMQGGAPSAAGSSMDFEPDTSGTSHTAVEIARNAAELRSINQNIDESKSRSNLNQTIARKELFLGNLAESEAVTARSLRPVKERVMEWLNRQGLEGWKGIEKGFQRYQRDIDIIRRR